jgi:DNA-binding response OmpR family regulator
MDPVIAGKKKILIVEDQESIRKFYRTILEGAGYSVLEAEDGEKGWSWAEAVVPDLILTDLMMPRMNGFDLLQKVRANAQTHDIPVLFLTLRGEDENSKKAMSLGANGFLVKGYVPPKVILEKIRAALLPAAL